MVVHNFGFSDEAQFRAFQKMALSVQADPIETAQFNAKVATPQELVVYSQSRGVEINEHEAQNIFDAAQQFVATQSPVSGETKLDDAMNEVNGGVSWAAVGGTIGGIVGVVAGVAAGIAAAPVIALGSVAGTVVLVGAAVVAGAGTAFSGAVTGGLVGGVSQFIHDKVTG
jgi:hypothetical protein